MSMPVWVSTDVPRCSPEESVQEAMRKMSRWDGESLPVCDSNQRLVGSISMRAVCLYANATGKRLTDVQVEEATERGNPICVPEDSAPDVMHRMSATGQWCLPMVDRNNVLIGMVRLPALLRSLEGDTDIIRIVSSDESNSFPTPSEGRRMGWSVLEQSRQLESPIGDRQRLPPAEFRLLLAFVRSAGKVLSRQALMRRVCDRDWDPSDRYIDVLVGNVRRAFGERASRARAIVTVRNEGYLFTLSVQMGSPSTKLGSRTRWSGGPRAMDPSKTLTGKRGSAQHIPQPVFLEPVNHVYEQRGATAAQTYCVKCHIIASICLCCGRLYQVVESQGAPGGLSHGWCSKNCAVAQAATPEGVTG